MLLLQMNYDIELFHLPKNVLSVDTWTKKLSDQPQPWFQGRSGNYYRLHVATDEVAEVVQYLRERYGHVGAADVSFLCMVEQSEIAPHLDDSPQEERQYLIMLQPAELGGILHLHFHELSLRAPTRVLEGISFHSGEIRHSVSRVRKGERYVLSIRFLKP